MNDLDEDEEVFYANIGDILAEKAGPEIQEHGRKLLEQLAEPKVTKNYLLDQDAIDRWMSHLSRNGVSDIPIEGFKDLFETLPELEDFILKDETETNSEKQKQLNREFAMSKTKAGSDTEAVSKLQTQVRTISAANTKLKMKMVELENASLEYLEKSISLERENAALITTTNDDAVVTKLSEMVAEFKDAIKTSENDPVREDAFTVSLCGWIVENFVTKA